MKITKSALYAELERVARIITEYKIDEKDLGYCRRALVAVLNQLSELHKSDAEKIEKRINTKKYNALVPECMRQNGGVK
jgi:hypothetical protein